MLQFVISIPDLNWKRMISTMEKVIPAPIERPTFFAIVRNTMISGSSYDKMTTIPREIPIPAKVEPEAAPPKMIMTAGIDRRYKITIRSADPENAKKPNTGINSERMTRLMNPIIGEAR
jgi:hypothetical protein